MRDGKAATGPRVCSIYAFKIAGLDWDTENREQKLGDTSGGQLRSPDTGCVCVEWIVLRSCSGRSAARR
jgi:hypothetical protein